MVAQSTSMDRGGDEIMAHSIHLEEWGESDGVPVVVSVFSLGEGGAGEGFDGDDT